MSLTNEQERAVSELRLALQRYCVPSEVIESHLQPIICELEAAQRGLAPRNGHTFESLQKMWEDTHIELAAALSKLTEAQRERDDLRAKLDEINHALLATEYVVQGQPYPPNTVARAKSIISERSMLRAKLEKTKAKLLASEAHGAEMRRIVQRVSDEGMCSCSKAIEKSMLNEDQHASVCILHKALSTTCGTAFLAERERHVKALEACIAFVTMKVPANVPAGFWEQYDTARDKAVELARTALQPK